MNFLANILNGINKKDKNEMTVEKAVKIFKNSKEKFEEFEEFYKKNVLTEIPENYFEVNSRQATDKVATAGEIDYELVKRIVDELADGTRLIEIKNSKVIEKTLTCENNPITDINELIELDKGKQVQFTKNFSKFDISPVESLKTLMFFAKHNYGMFRGGLETLDLSPTLYKILDNNMNQMGYWLPKVAEISPFKIPDTKIMKVPLSLLQLGRVFEYNELTPTTFKIINEYCKKVFELDLNSTYFIKNGVFSSKFDFRNAKVTTPQEVAELGQYLFYIHQQACQMASLLNNKSIYGCGTTNEWIVREYIESPVKETIYMGLPLNTEYRIFVDFDTKAILSDNQYWNKEVMNKRFEENRNSHDVHDVITYNMASERLEKTYNENIDKVKEMVQELLNNNIEMTGQWSVDIMQVENDFYLIDMALAENSFYYDSVPKELRKPTTERWLELK
jgi:hypothetical protein